MRALHYRAVIAAQVMLIAKQLYGLVARADTLWPRDW
jgi:hypothetical protein